MATLTEKKAQFEGLKSRAKEAAEQLNAKIPVSNLPAAAQESFLLAISDLKLLEQLLQTAQNSLNAIALQEEPKPKGDGDDFFYGMVDCLNQLVKTINDEFGVSKELILPTVFKDLTRQLELIETVLIRCEESVNLIAE